MAIGVSGDGDLTRGFAISPSAELTHPNIARMIDGRVTETGVPYLVLEFVHGLPITPSNLSGAATMIVTTLRSARQRNARRNDA